MEIRLVADAGSVTDSLRSVDAPVVGVDVERANGGSYTRPAVLVQVGGDGGCVAVDVLAVPDLAPLAAWLEGRLAVFHALENDLGPLRDAGADLPPEEPPHAHVADTAVAAALLGLPTGLAPLLAGTLGVALSPDKERFQRADWTVRPLKEAMLAYAAGDGAHLPALWATLAGQLEEAGRTDWYEQELAAAVEAERTSTRDWTRTKGAGRLDGRGRTFLRALWEEREEIARVDDVAPQRVVRDDVLVDLADDPPQTMGVLRRGPIRERQADAYGDRLLAAIRRAEKLPDEPGLADGRPASDESRQAYDRMRKARAVVAREVGVDSGVLCPSRVLREAVVAQPEDPAGLCEAAGLRPWQRDLLGDVLWDAYCRRAD
jgi:ribonuclease D